nr:hypothetical protein [bacterium]
MPIETAEIKLSDSILEEKEELSPFELRKLIAIQILKDINTAFRIFLKISIVFIFLYGSIAILQDVNLI